MGPGLGLGLLGNKQVQVHGLTAVPNCAQRLRTVYQRIEGGGGFGFGFGFLGEHFGLALAAFAAVCLSNSSGGKLCATLAHSSVTID